jgi:nucleotide-binding universal stress UspA family protein
MEKTACSIAFVGVPMAPREVMLVVDDIDSTRQALHFLKRFPLPAGTTILMLGVLSPVKAGALASQNPHTWFRLLKPRGSERRAVETLALEARELFCPTGWRTEVAFVAGETTESVLVALRERLPDLVVLAGDASHGPHQRPHAEVWRIARSAPCPVLVVRAEPNHADLAPALLPTAGRAP